MVSMVPMFRRATIGTLLPQYEDKGLPRIFVMAEYDEKPPPEYMAIVRSTEWSKKMLGSFVKSDKNDWKLAMEFGQAKDGMDVSG